MEQHIQNGGDLSDYASVEDAVKHTELLASLGHTSPSMSPPPLPPSSSKPTLSPSHIQDDEEEQAEYATVDTASNQRVTSPTGKGRGYDHLAPDESYPVMGYDKLNPPARPPRTDRAQIESSNNGYDPIFKTRNTTRGGTPPPSEEEYATIEEDSSAQNIDQDMYATVDTTAKTRPKPHPKPHTPSHVPPGSDPATNMEVGGDMYSAVNIAHKTRPAPRPAPRSRVSPDPFVESTEGGDLYSIPNKPRPGSGHHRMQSEDHILHYRASGEDDPQHMYSAVEVTTPPLTTIRRAVTPENALYSIPDKQDKKRRPHPSPPVRKAHPSPPPPKPRPSPPAQRRNTRNTSPSVAPRQLLWKLLFIVSVGKGHHVFLFRSTLQVNSHEIWISRCGTGI